MVRGPRAFAILLACAALATAKAAPADDLAARLVHTRLELRDAQRAGDAEREAAALLDLGRLHRAVGRHAEAEALLRKALDLDRRRGDREAQGADLNQLGLGDLHLGRSLSAARHFTEAFEHFRAAERPLAAASTLTNLGLARAERGDLRGALTAHTQARDLFALARDDAGRADAETNLGIVLGALGRHDESIASLRAAAERFAQLGDDPGRAAALHNLANTHARLGDWERAAALHRQAAPLASPAQRPAIDKSLGALLLAAGRADEAAAHLREALRERPGDAGLLLNLAQAQARLDPATAAAAYRAALDAADNDARRCAALLGLAEHDPGDARRHVQRAVKLASKLHEPELRWRSAFASSQLRRRAGEPWLDPVREAVAVLEVERSALERLDPVAARAFVSDRRTVYEALIDGLLEQGQTLAAATYLARLELAELGPDEHLARLDAHRASLVGKLAEADGAPEGTKDSERIAALQTELAANREAFSAYVDELRARDGFAELVRVDPADIEAWQGELSSEEAVLQPVLLPDRLALLLFTREALHHVEVPVARDDVLRRVSRVIATMRDRRLARPERLREHLDALGDWLWEPVADRLPRRVIVVGSGPLRAVPAALLRRGGRYLVQDHEIAHVANVGSLKRRLGEELLLRQGGLLALGNPDGTLPGADEEVDALVALAGGTALHGSDADRASLGTGASVLHLATHGVLDPAEPARSHIVLADGPLTHRAIPGMHAQLRGVQLVVLSACETAVPLTGEPRALAGLAAQFHRAGVPRLLASQWAVSDESTRELMTAFYEELLGGRDPVAALASAQRRLLARPDTAHPFHWGPFVLLGTPR